MFWYVISYHIPKQWYTTTFTSESGNKRWEMWINNVYICSDSQIVMLVNFINWSDPTYNGPYPLWARGIGWMISSSTLMWIPIFIIYRLTSNSGSITEVLIIRQFHSTRSMMYFVKETYVNIILTTWTQRYGVKWHIMIHK